MTDCQAIHEIQRLKYRYLRALDSKDWTEFEACFVPEATGAYAGLDFDCRDAILDYMRANVGDGVITVHQAHHPEIDVDGDEATGRWYLQDKVIVETFRLVLEGAAFYSDRYVRTAAGWRISHTGYRRHYEATWSLDDVPTWRLRAGGA